MRMMCTVYIDDNILRVQFSCIGAADPRKKILTIASYSI